MSYLSALLFDKNIESWEDEETAGGAFGANHTARVLYYDFGAPWAKPIYDTTTPTSPEIIELADKVTIQDFLEIYDRTGENIEELNKEWQEIGTRERANILAYRVDLPSIAVLMCLYLGKHTPSWVEEKLEKTPSSLKILENIREKNLSLYKIKEQITRPIDKVNREILATPIQNQLSFYFLDYDENGVAINPQQEINGAANEVDLINSKTGVYGTVTYALDFTAAINDPTTSINLSKPLDKLDSLIYSVLDQAKRNGAKAITCGQIYRALKQSNTKMAPEAKAKYLNRIAKMSQATLKIHQLPMAKNKNAAFSYSYCGPLLPVVIISKHINGQVDDSTIYFLESAADLGDGLPLLELARRQSRAIETNLKLYSTIQLTDTNITIADYLNDRIYHMRGATVDSTKIKWDSLFEKCNIPNKRKDRAITTAEKLLKKYFIPMGLIEKYENVEGGIQITPNLTEQGEKKTIDKHRRKERASKIIKNKSDK